MLFLKFLKRISKTLRSNEICIFPDYFFLILLCKILQMFVYCKGTFKDINNFFEVIENKNIIFITFYNAIMKVI